MKLSAWHKAQGDDVSMYMPLMAHTYNTVYSSKVFTFTKTDTPLGNRIVKGGTGYNFSKKLPEDIEHICPDYKLYNSTFSQGFLTRGCPNKCAWCIVPRKEGNIQAHADIEEFARHKAVVLMDNNVLACDHGISQIEKMARMGLRVDFNQGLDARRIDSQIAKMLAALKWSHPIRLACDTKSQIESVHKAIDKLRKYGAKPSRFFCYVLVKDIEDALERVLFLKENNVDPFAQPYIDFSGKNTVPKIQKDFARWVNHKAIFKSVPWEQYSRRTGHAHKSA